MAGLLDSITGFFEGPTDPTAIDPRYGISQQQLYDAKMASLGSAGMTLLAAGQRMQPGERAQLLGQLGNIPGQYQQSISDAMKQRLLASQLRSGEQDLAANEAFSKRLAGVLPGAPTAAGAAPMQGGIPMQGGVSMPPNAARLAQPMPPTAPGAVAPMTGAALPAPAADLASLNLTQQEATYLAQLPPSEQRAAYSQIQQKKLTEKPEFAERPMTPAEIAAGGLDASLPWYMGDKGPFIPGGRPPVGSTTNINMKAPAVYDAELAKSFNADVDSAIQAGRAAQDLISGNNTMRSILDKGAFTGPLAGRATQLTLFADQLGLAPEDALRKAQNSSQLIQQYASRSLDAAKKMEGQGAIAQQERVLLEQAAGGGIEITAEVQRRVMDILEKGYKKQAELGRRAIKFKRPGAYDSMGDFYDMYYPTDTAGAQNAPAASGAAPATTGGKVFRFNPATNQMEPQ